jgi:predicted hydrocarbon binding protein
MAARAQGGLMAPGLAGDGAGRLFLGGSRYLLIRPETLVALQRAVETAVGPRGVEIMATGGRAGGARATATLPGAAEDRVRRLCAMGGEIGWGEFALERLGPRELVVTVRHSPFAETWGRAEAPVCHLTRGVLEALAAAVLEAPLPVVETECAAAGAALCRFQTVPTRDPGSCFGPVLAGRARRRGTA